MNVYAPELIARGWTWEIHGRTSTVWRSPLGESVEVSALALTLIIAPEKIDAWRQRYPLVKA